MGFETINPKGSEAMYSQFHFSQAVRSGDFLLCSGQIGAGADGKAPADPEEEFRNAFQAVGRVLEEAGLSFGDIVEMTTFHVSMNEHLGSFMKVKDQFIKDPFPAWTAIGTTELALPGALVEIRVTARI